MVVCNVFSGNGGQRYHEAQLLTSKTMSKLLERTHHKQIRLLRMHVYLNFIKADKISNSETNLRIESTHSTETSVVLWYSKAWRIYQFNNWTSLLAVSFIMLLLHLCAKHRSSTSQLSFSVIWCPCTLQAFFYHQRWLNAVFWFLILFYIKMNY